MGKFRDWQEVLESPEQGIRSGSRRPREKSQLTVAIVRPFGRLLSFRISARVLFWAAMFLITYIIVSIWIINSYFDLRHINIMNSEKLRQLENEALKNRKALHVSKERMTLLNHHVKHLEEHRKRGSQKNPIGGHATRGLGNSTGNKRMENRSTKVVDIQDVAVRNDGVTMTVNFKVVKVQPGGKRVGGYIHIIAENKKSNPPVVWTCPEEKLEKGVPIDFRCGQSFLIKRFRPIHGKFDLVPGLASPTIIKVLVYDRSGVPVLKESFKVRDVS